MICPACAVGPAPAATSPSPGGAVAVVHDATVPGSPCFVRTARLHSKAMAPTRPPEYHPAFEEYCEAIFELREDDVEVIRPASPNGSMSPSAVSEMIGGWTPRAWSR
jgi:hypothetical protein